jgi:arylsulfatase A-like enzyme|tara:strand:- start:225 stop:1841 length:1617 start_codon:yes stop_codon:yes gene_type:complete
MLYLKRITSFYLLFILFSCEIINHSSDQRKNVLIILADDLGYSDLGCFGSEISTPNIDFLASSGTIFSNFYTSPLCAPSRAMLLSGNDNHVSGIGIQAFSSPNYGYEGILSNRVAILPEVLKINGYKSYMVGKWHIGGDPYNRGFDKTFALLPGAFSHYDNNKPIRGYPDSAFSENGKKRFWDVGKYSSDFYTDKLIEFLEPVDKDPFFAYASFTAPHWPLQVDEKYSNNYKGIYDEGYDVLKIKRFNSLKGKNIIHKEKVFPSFETLYSSWDKLDDYEKSVESRKMEIYAGMIENLDFNVGRIIKFLKENGLYDNTVILFMSDNGAAGEDFYYNNTYGNYIQENFNYDYEDMGKPNSFVSLGVGWAEAITSPFRLYKGYTTSGGMKSPLIISGINENKISSSNEFLSLLDIAPSIYDLLNIKYPLFFNNNELSPPIGESVIPYLKSESSIIHKDDYVFAFEHSGNSFLKKGEWKIINTIQPFNVSNFELYNIKNDISEITNKKNMNREIYDDLIVEWNNFSKSRRLIFPTPYIDNLK